ncbi:hypothetical protein Pint_31640 [Pistacia integerrima]|uniref:Uncharacterized protein n=1 Tax=Pistacia integerrima TaxID=434235 RepID=A0ACC0XSP0_9ROSI|nr:hypothetical protein Pint_31640 [Pistacia integerrima]
MGSDDQSYLSVIQQQDEDGEVGVSLSPSLAPVAGKALGTNILQLGPFILPYSEQLQFGWSGIRRKIWSVPGKKELHVPNFGKAFEHFCIHASRRTIIQAVENNLRLQKEDGEASRMTLHLLQFGMSFAIWR